MRLKLILAVTGLALLLAFPAAAQNTEQELINKYLQKTEKKQKTKKLYWVSANYSMNRINRDNDYNKFAIYESSLFTNTDLNWLNTAMSFGLEFGWLVNNKFSWTLGGEYWMPVGETQLGNFDYNPPSGNTTVTELKSEIKVYGVATGVQFYVLNAPTVEQRLTKAAVKIGVGAGYYQAKWEVWDQYENLNLATSSPAGTNSTFKDNGIGFTFSLGAEYPLSASGFALGLDVHYLWLNFDQVSWYNAQEQEVVATFEGNSSSRVNLGLSGVRGKLEIKRFFNW
jgi:hypothetical protein